MLIFVTVTLLGWFLWMLIKQYIAAAQELGRFKGEAVDIFQQLGKQFNLLLIKIGNRSASKQTLSYQAAKSEKEMNKKLKAAGLESAAEQGRFFLIRALSFVIGPLIGLSTYGFFPAYYATISTIATSAAGIVVPMIWLKSKTTNRTEDIQRELPLLLDLINLGTSAGWDVAASLERVIDAVNVEFPNHPLIKEFRRARWLTASGYTWNEALERVSRVLENDSVRRSTVALTQAMKQGGDRSSQLEGIAEDAQRVYYSSLDRRLAALPVQALFVTMLLMISYFFVLLAPAAVQVKNTVNLG